MRAATVRLAAPSGPSQHRLAGPAARQRRLLTRGVAAWIAAWSFSGAALAQDYPNRPVRVIVPYVAGGLGDLATRALVTAVGQQLGQSFVVENLSGGSGIPAMQAGLRAAPDGYTLSYADTGQWAINAALFAQLPYDTLRDFAPIRMFGVSNLFILVPGNSPLTSLTDLVAQAKARPGVLTYASSGVGSPHHMMMEDLKARLGLNILHIPYRGTAQSVPAVLAGDVAIGVASLPAVAGFLKDGRLKALGTTGKERSPSAPNVPTIGEAVSLGFDGSAGFGLLAPARTPRPVIDKVADAMRRALASADVATRLATLGVDAAVNSSPESFAERIRDERTTLTRIARSAGIKAE